VSGKPAVERTGGTNTDAPRRDKGAGQMRTMRDIEVDTSLDSDPLGGGEDLSNQPINDPDD
jgi:hypothetical protein